MVQSGNSGRSNDDPASPSHSISNFFIFEASLETWLKPAENLQLLIPGVMLRKYSKATHTAVESSKIVICKKLY